MMSSANASVVIYGNYDDVSLHAFLSSCAGFFPARFEIFLISTAAAMRGCVAEGRLEAVSPVAGGNLWQAIAAASGSILCCRAEFLSLAAPSMPSLLRDDVLAALVSEFAAGAFAAEKWGRDWLRSPIFEESPYAWFCPSAVFRSCQNQDAHFDAWMQQSFCSCFARLLFSSPSVRILSVAGPARHPEKSFADACRRAWELWNLWRYMQTGALCDDNVVAETRANLVSEMRVVMHHLAKDENIFAELAEADMAAIKNRVPLDGFCFALFSYNALLVERLRKIFITIAA